MSFETNLVAFAEKVKAGIEEAAGDVVKLATFLSNSQTEISGLASLTGATGQKVTATATSVLSAVIKAVEDAGAAALSNGLNVSFDAAVIADVKAIVDALKKI